MTATTFRSLEEAIDESIAEAFETAHPNLVAAIREVLDKGGNKRAIMGIIAAKVKSGAFYSMFYNNAEIFVDLEIKNRKSKS